MSECVLQNPARPSAFIWLVGSLAGVGKCPFLGILNFEHHLPIFVGDYIPNTWVIFNWDIYQPLVAVHQQIAAKSHGFPSDWRQQEGWLLKRSKTLHVWRRRWASLWDEPKTAASVVRCGFVLPINLSYIYYIYI